MGAGDTIVALSSGPLPSGVAVIRISGPEAAAILEKAAGRLPGPRRLVLAAVRDGSGEALDTGLVAFFPGPHSFTGEDCAELHLHGSPAVVKAVLREVTAGPGVRLAEAGEFTRRAFENGKLDALEVEGLADVIAAETESQRRLAVARAQGELSRHIGGWRQLLLALRAEIEAQLDFSDEGDVGEGLDPGFESRVRRLVGELDAMLATGDGGRVIREGLRIALAGPPNAGKSSLLNVLARSDVAIVTDEPGTTRDVHEVRVDIGGQLVVLVDTAGLRNTESRAEAEGVRRARRAMAEADLVLWLVAPDVADPGPPEGLNAPVWRVGTKLDLGAVEATDFTLSSRDGRNIDRLIDRIGRFAESSAGCGAPVVISRERDRVALAACRQALLDAIEGPSAPEMVAEELRRASFALERLVGRMDAESVLGQLFSRFCIGK